MAGYASRALANPLSRQLRPFAPIFVVYVLATWFTDAFFMGDTWIYVSDLLKAHVGGEHIHPRHRLLHFAREAVGAGGGLRRLAVDLRQFEAPDPVAGAVRADLGHELSEGQGGHRRGGQARTQDR